MKKLIVLTACLGFMTATIFAQNKQSSATKSAKSTKSTAKYYCPKCHASSDKPGTCSGCNAKMVKEGDYYCPGCGASSSKPGKCTSCNKDMVKMTASAK